MVVACSSARLGGPDGSGGVTLPARFAEGKNESAKERADAGAPTDGGSAQKLEKLAARRQAGSLPDPEPLIAARYWQYRVLYDRGRVSVTSVRPLRYDRPVATPRYVGRFAIELWIGHELVDRVRFDFPVIAAEDVKSGPRRPLEEPPSLAAGAAVTQSVLVPASSRATRAELVDRATGSREPLPWPPDHPLPVARSELTPKERAVLRRKAEASLDGGSPEAGTPAPSVSP